MAISRRVQVMMTVKLPMQPPAGERVRGESWTQRMMFPFVAWNQWVLKNGRKLQSCHSPGPRHSLTARNVVASALHVSASVHLMQSSKAAKHHARHAWCVRWNHFVQHLSKQTSSNFSNYWLVLVTIIKWRLLRPLILNNQRSVKSSIFERSKHKNIKSVY